MHRCLYIAEIVQIVAAFLRRTRSRKTLLAFALTCRAICEPAMDELWRRDISLANLARTLPQHLLEARHGRLV